MLKLSDDEFAELVREALRDIPDALMEFMANIVVDVEPRPSREDLEAVGIDDPTELLGLYHGTPLTERMADDGVHLPDRISIYKKNLEMMCDSREELIEQIRTTVFHEVGHYFGLDEDELEALGYD